MQSWWHSYIKKILLGHFAPSKIAMKANFNFKPRAGNPTPDVKSNQYKGKISKLKSERHSRLFWIQLQWKPGHFLKTVWQELLREGYPIWKRSWGNANIKVSIKINILKTWLFHHDPMTFTNLDILPLKALDMLFSLFHCFKPKKKSTA